MKIRSLVYFLKLAGGDLVVSKIKSKLLEYLFKPCFVIEDVIFTLVKVST